MADLQSTPVIRPLRIYLAGKITKNNWRDEVVVGLRDWEALYPDHAKIGQDWPTLYGAIGGHDYVGPFAMYSAAHTFEFHADNQHGNQADAGYMSGSHVWGKSLAPCDDATDDGEWPSEIARRCKVAIDAADLVFGWFDDTSAFGTLVEVGYALGAGKAVQLGFSRSVFKGRIHHDLWFALHLSRWQTRWPRHVPVSCSDTAGEALWMCVTKNDARPAYHTYIVSEAWRDKARAAKERAHHHCQVCNAGHVQLDAHHRTYERLGRELATDITVLCRTCHGLFEMNRKAQRSA